MQAQQVFQVLMAILVVAAVLPVLRLYKWLREGGLYYRQYPGAKLMDDIAGARLDMALPETEEIIRRVGSAKDQRAVVAQIRRERGLES
jgi:hypothetical protein